MYTTEVESHFPNYFRQAFITPIVKKPNLDPANVSSYCPISNLPVLSKLLERLVIRQLLDYLTSMDLRPTLQSGFRAGHSTETAILRVLSDIILAVDHGDVAALVLLDLSAAFDTVDHDIVTAFVGDVQHQRRSPPVDPVVSLWPDATCTSWAHLLYYRTQTLLHCTGIRCICNGTIRGSLICYLMLNYVCK